MNDALLLPRLYLVQAKYILRVVITQMRGSEGYEVNLTSISLTPGLDCLRGFLEINVINLLNLSYQG